MTRDEKECKHEFLMRHEYGGNVWWQCEEGCDFLFRKDISGMRRRDLDGKIPVEIEPELLPGDYARSGHGLWCVRAPNGDSGTLWETIHQIVEHEDGTITVSPSVQFETGARWHGYLRAGVWTA